MELPLFPLHTVLCPGIALPLHIFEERYRELVRHCIETESPFGVVLIREGREVGAGAIAFSAVGTLAEIRQAGRYPDGRYDLLVVGTGRFAIEDVTVDRRPYLLAEATILDERIGDEAEARRLANLATRRFVRYLELLQPRSGEAADEIDVRVEVETERIVGDAPGPDDEPPERRVVIPDDPTTLSYLLAGIIQIELPRRQALLEAETTEDRLRLLLGLISRETFLLSRRLRAFLPNPEGLGPRRS
ncbi:MAG TPA: LON peptidase substrate-binding domain-containing protein [Candidatus Limnocylindrales bacterium]|jgi:Lon protease-like protein|nr:LON peptidase substrate-binding domain-containing protein [Candidatus Limnocylindrales bacterium]